MRKLSCSALGLGSCTATGFWELAVGGTQGTGIPHSEVAELAGNAFVKDRAIPQQLWSSGAETGGCFTQENSGQAVLFFTAPAIPGAVNPCSLDFVPALGSCTCSPKQAALIVRHFHAEEAKKGDPAGIGHLAGGVGCCQTDWPWMKYVIPSHLA